MAKLVAACNITGPNGELIIANDPEAGVIHDWGYRGNLTRETADAVYLELLLHLGMSRTRAYLRYRALRVFGRFSYKGVKPSKRP